MRCRRRATSCGSTSPTSATTASRCRGRCTCRPATSRARRCRSSCGRTRASSATPTRRARSPDRRTRSRCCAAARTCSCCSRATRSSSAQAAVDKVVEMGVADRDRIGVGGHSYGGFMTANLLAHSRLFRAGFAESGAYNRSLTPFGFQSERRTFWEVPDLYAKMSPFWYANQIKDPILLMHGEADDNTGTYPINSERLYAAIKGLGGTARLVMLPNEAHGYAARETLLHVLAERLNWFDRYVKNAGARSTTDASR
ncbi:MAG: hypothetical protein DMF93_05270 [Acidobacteria bacterium]|nr:MAG: hypothetical protein DMF93_05270 [Acidobacteriota bacterium]